MSSGRSLITMGAFAMAGNTPLVVQPMIVGAMVDVVGLTERQAGILASVELGGLTFGILGLIRVATHVARPMLAVFAVGTIVAANLTTCFVSSFEFLVPLRALSGVGAAAALCVYLSMATAEARPEHVFAVVNAVAIAYSGALTLVAPFILQAGGLAAMLCTLSLITVLALVTAPWTRSSDEALTRGSPALVVRLVPAQVLPLLAMMLLLYTGHGAIWAFQERIGVAAGLSEHAVGKWIGLSMLVWGVCGSLLARLLSLSIGRIWPQTLSLGASCLAVLLLVFGSTPFTFAASCGLIAFSWFYGLPYQMGLLAARDPKGRAALAGVMMSTGGMTIGPAVSAMLIAGSAHWPIGVFAGGCYLAALAIAVPSAAAIQGV